jgi:poly(3-hydroxybutyrate) depolymerase
MNAENDKAAPASITLIGGPIDTRKAPTKVNQFAKEHSLDWFQTHLITVVPFKYPGFMRRVYPGFLQLASFISMNLERHVDAHVQFFNHLVEGDGESAQQHKKFYDEYLSVADITAEFYLQTMDTVFHKHALPKGEMLHRDVPVNPKAITKTAILCLEGELDDISGLGQTKAAMEISTSLPASMKKYHMEPKVGHYGIFNGRKFREHVVPIISEWIEAHDH